MNGRKHFTQIAVALILLSFSLFLHPMDRMAIRLVTTIEQVKEFTKPKSISIPDWAGITNDSNDSIIKSNQIIQNQLLSFKKTRNCQYQEPYFFFQATYGETPSDFYLFSLNVQTGQLIKVHKGFHRQFWIQDNRLYFQHTDHFFVCHIPDWNPKPILSDPIKNEQQTLSTTYKVEIPSLLRVLDYENIHAVMEGSFTKPGLQELLFISGREPSYAIGVFARQNGKMLLTEKFGQQDPMNPGEIIPINQDQRHKMANFQQAFYQDADNDKCLETYILGQYAAWSYDPDPLLFIDISKPKANVKYQLVKLGEMENLYEPEFMRYNGQIIIPCTHYRDNQSYSSAYVIEYSVKSGFVSIKEMSSIPINLLEMIQETSIAGYKNRLLSSPARKDLSFARTGRNLSDAGKPVILHSKKLPTLKICPLYNANNPGLTSEEKRYHLKRNRYLTDFVKKLDSGWNPIPHLPHFFEHESLNKQNAYQCMRSIDDIIPILSEGKERVVVVIYFRGEDESYTVPGTIMMLCDPSFQVLDSRGLYPVMYANAKILLPLPSESQILVSYSYPRSNADFDYYRIDSEKIIKQYSISANGFDVFSAENQLILQINHRSHYLVTGWGDGGNGVGFYYNEYMNIFTKEDVAPLLIPLYQIDLNYLYRMHHFYAYQKDDNISMDDAGDSVHAIIEQYEKLIYYNELVPHPMVEDDG